MTVSVSAGAIALFLSRHQFDWEADENRPSHVVHDSHIKMGTSRRYIDTNVNHIAQAGVMGMNAGFEPAAHTLPSCACAINIVYRRLT